MGAHLRNGKNISFKQQAAARDQQRAEQQGAEQQRSEQQHSEQYHRSHLSKSALEAMTASPHPNQQAPSTATRTQPQPAHQLDLTPSHVNQTQIESHRGVVCHTPPALPRLSAFAELESSLPPLMGFEELDQITETNPAYDPHRGVSPLAVNSQAASIALASTQSTPVSRPVERQEFLVTRREIPLPPPPRDTESTTPVQNQLVLREMTEVPQQPDHAATISDVFHGQWLLYMNAKEQNNYSLMRLALNKAILSQDALKSLLGTQSMLDIAEGWIAREALALLDQEMLAPTQKAPARLTNHQEATHNSLALTTNQLEREVHMFLPHNRFHQNQVPQERLLLLSNQVCLPQAYAAIDQRTYLLIPFQLMPPNRNTLIRPATAQQLLAQPMHPHPLLAPMPTRPATGLQATQLAAAPPIPPHTNNQIPPQHSIVQQPHHQVHQYYGQEYYANPPPQHQLEYPQQAPYPLPQGEPQYQDQLHHTGPQYH
ncbi:hypothetical protein PCANC_24332 [Puccinia coronata f. sp. avenae]|uniref:Uncharacterized protein n=1 Tax=Puccinia coronata f. sp. avenae TaxID=200324 RepID=A0A2N5TV99_9BASI|nr:hypothetical protein PCANC_24332 [Puccinia coronata f. sp. avenae]